MTVTIARTSLPALFLTALWTTDSHALLVDNFDTDVSVAVVTAAPDSDASATPDDANMIGDRVITVNKTAGPASGAQGAYATATGGVLSLANGPSTNSNVTIDWTFGTSDLTEGGTQTDIVVVLPAPIDNDLTIAFSINGGPALSILFPDGSSGDDFVFPFADFANSADAATASSLSVTFSDGIAWDAQVDFIETRGPSPPPPGPPPTPVPTLSLHALGLTVLGLLAAAATHLRRSGRVTRKTCRR